MSSEVLERAQKGGQTGLSGIRVVDLTQFEAGTACTQTLAWLGAEVIKVEPPGRGEPGRGGGTRPGVDSTYFMLLNANKQSVTIDLKLEQGRALLRSLIEKSDVMVENFAPGTIERLGFGWDVVREINPRLVFAQIKGFAPDSPFGSYLCQDLIAQAVGGVMAVTGEENGAPLHTGVALGDSGTGIQCALGIVTALFQRQSTGRGQRVEIAMQEALTNLGRTSYLQYTLGKPYERRGNKKVHISPYNAYPCKGGGANDYCCILVSPRNNKHWARLLKVIGREDLTEAPRFATTADRIAHRDEVDTLISDWTRQHDKIAVMKAFGEAGVVAGAVFAPEDLANDPFLKKRGAFVTVQHPAAGDFTMPAFPVKLSDSNVPVTPAPLLGSSTEKVFGDLLGLSPERLAELRDQKVI